MVLIDQKAMHVAWKVRKRRPKVESGATHGGLVLSPAAAATAQMYRAGGQVQHVWPNEGVGSGPQGRKGPGVEASQGVQTQGEAHAPLAYQGVNSTEGETGGYLVNKMVLHRQGKEAK